MSVQSSTCLKRFTFSFRAEFIECIQQLLLFKACACFPPAVSCFQLMRSSCGKRKLEEQIESWACFSFSQVLLCSLAPSSRQWCCALRVFPSLLLPPCLWNARRGTKKRLQEEFHHCPQSSFFGLLGMVWGSGAILQMFSCCSKHSARIFRHSAGMHLMLSSQSYFSSEMNSSLRRLQTFQKRALCLHVPIPPMHLWYCLTLGSSQTTPVGLCFCWFFSPCFPFMMLNIVISSCFWVKMSRGKALF